MHDMDSRWRSVWRAAALVGFAGALLSVQPATAASLEVELAFESPRYSGNPPDTMGAVGPEELVAFTNGGVVVFRKSDGMLLAEHALDTFWSDAGVALTFDTYDPRVVYDAESGRFFAVALNDRRTSNQILVAVSSSSDPSDPWTGFAVDSDSTDTVWADFPTIGVDADTVTIAVDMHEIPDSALPVSVDVLVIPKADLLAAEPTLAGATLFERTHLNVTGFAPQPVTSLDGAGLPSWLFSSGVAFVGVLQTTRIAGSATTPTIAAGPFLDVDSMPTPPAAVQPNDTLLDAGDGHLASPVQIGDSIWATHAATGSSLRGAIRWYEFDATTAAVLQSGVIEDPERDYLYPSISANADGDVVIGFSASSASLMPSAFAVLGETVGGTTTFGEPILVYAGTASLTGFGTVRFGDYSATVADPGDASLFWTFQEIGSTPNNRAIAVGALRVVPELGARESALAGALVLFALSAVRARDCASARRRRTLRASA